MSEMEKLQGEIAELMKTYHDKMEEINKLMVEPNKLSALIKEKKKQLCEFFKVGAKDCDCEKSDVYGRCKRAGMVVKGEEKPPIYEVGCFGCEKKARSYSIEKTVEMWNNKKFVG